MNRKSSISWKSLLSTLHVGFGMGQALKILGGRLLVAQTAVLHRRGSVLLVSAWALFLSVSVGVCAQPVLSLVKSGTLSATVDSIVVGSATYLLDLRVNTGGNSVSGLQYHLETTPVASAIYGTTPLTVLSNPFQPPDVVVAPSAGAIVRLAGGTTVLFKGSGADYPAFADNAIATYQLDTQNLAPGTYVFTAVGEELTNASATVTTFGASGSFTLTILSDIDQDGMPDVFESANTLNPNSPADASKDEDGDGVTNLKEFLAGTNPRNSASALRASIQRIADSVHVSFGATANKVYQVEYITDLAEASDWAVFSENITRSTDGVLQVSDSTTVGVMKRFYRVRVMR